MKSNVLFKKITKKLLFPIFLAAFEFHIRKTTHLLRLTMSQFIFWHLHKNESTAKPGHVPLIRTSDNWTEQCLVNTANGGSTSHLNVSK